MPASCTEYLDDLEALKLHVVVWLLDSLQQVAGQLSAALEVRVRHLRNLDV